MNRPNCFVQLLKTPAWLFALYHPLSGVAYMQHHCPSHDVYTWPLFPKCHSHASGSTVKQRATFLRTSLEAGSLCLETHTLPVPLHFGDSGIQVIQVLRITMLGPSGPSSRWLPTWSVDGAVSQTTPLRQWDLVTWCNHQPVAASTLSCLAQNGTHLTKRNRDGNRWNEALTKQNWGFNQ